VEGRRNQRRNDMIVVQIWEKIEANRFATWVRVGEEEGMSQGKTGYFDLPYPPVSG
jgi:hypothetical protein